MGIKYLCISASDSPNQNLVQYLSQSNDFIHRARISGGNVLVHCLAGISRSVTLVAAYLMSITTLSGKEVLQAIRAVRRDADPNDGFLKQLHHFESLRLKQERNRLSAFPQILTKSEKEEMKSFQFESEEVELRRILLSQANNTYFHS